VQLPVDNLTGRGSLPQGQERVRKSHTGGLPDGRLSRARLVAFAVPFLPWRSTMRRSWREEDDDEAKEEEQQAADDDEDEEDEVS